MEFSVLGANNLEEFRAGVLELHIQTTAMIQVLLTIIVQAGLATEEQIEEAVKIVEIRLRQQVDQESARVQEEQKNIMVERVVDVLKMMGVEDPDEDLAAKIVDGDLEGLFKDLLSSMQEKDEDNE